MLFHKTPFLDPPRVNFRFHILTPLTVWPLLAKIPEKRMDELKEAYRVLNTRWTPHDQAIQRDIGRTFPAHQYFKESVEILLLYYSKLIR